MILAEDTCLHLQAVVHDEVCCLSKLLLLLVELLFLCWVDVWNDRLFRCRLSCWSFLGPLFALHLLINIIHVRLNSYTDTHFRKQQHTVCLLSNRSPFLACYCLIFLKSSSSSANDIKES